MSQFLQQLRNGSNAIDNNAPPDKSGAITRRIQKQYASESVENIGLDLTDDAEIKNVRPNSAAAIANIPRGYMICNVNGEFVETKAQFFSVASRNTVNLDLKLQSVDGMAELIARILSEEDKTEEGRAKINFDELLRTTPRYNFLSSEHPMFRRYSRRLMERKQARALIRQKARETEEQQRRERKELMQKEMAAEAEKEAREKAAREEAKKAVAPPPPPPAAVVEDKPFIEAVEVEGSFMQNNNNNNNNNSNNSVAVDNAQGSKKEGAEQEDSDNSLDIDTLKHAPASPPQQVAVPPAAEEVSASELLSLIGVPSVAAPVIENTTPVLAELPKPKIAVAQYVLLPSEEYTLTNGEKVICTLKKRSGPLPMPPPGKPPKINKATEETLKRARSSSR